MLLGIFGDLGSGKNVYATWYVLRYYVEKGLYDVALSNFRIISPDPRRPVGLLGKEEFKTIDHLDNALVVMDEAYLWADSRRSMSKENLAVSRVALQSRKRGMDILYIAQVKSSVDLRLYNISQIVVFAERVCNCREARRDITKCKWPDYHGFRYEENWRSVNHPAQRFRFLSNRKTFKLLPYFNTDEIVSIV